MSSEESVGIGSAPIRLTGTEPGLVAEVPGAGVRWKQVHFNLDVMRRFFHLEPEKPKSIVLERISDSGVIQNRSIRSLVFSDSNSNAKLEFDFSPLPKYPNKGTKPILVVVESVYLTFRYRLLLPGIDGYDELVALLTAGPSVGKGVKRRLVSLDEIESFWPQSGLRGV